MLSVISGGRVSPSDKASLTLCVDSGQHRAFTPWSLFQIRGGKDAADFLFPIFSRQASYLE